MKIAAIIPSRFHSTRFPGKPLALIAGKTMIERVYRQVEKAKCFADIIVATDDRRIFDTVTAFGGIARMTDVNINSGSERVWAVLQKSEYDAAVNIQGDEPLLSEKLIFQVFDALEKKESSVISAARRNDSFQDYCSKNVVKVVLSASNQAMYFSRSPIPFFEEGCFQGFFQHIGIYGYTREALASFVKGEFSPLEKTEKLEQLRFLHQGLNITIVLTDCRSHGVDVPDDIDRVTAFLEERHA